MLSEKIIPAKRTDEVTYAIRDIVVLANEVAKTGMEMLYLNIGDPNVYDHTTPRHIIDATYKAMLENKNGYSPSSGIPEAIDSIRRDAERKGITDIHDIFITHGASEAIELCMTALANNGENVLLPTPGYPLYTAIQSKLELVANPYYMDENSNWEPDIEDIKKKINPKTRGIVLINPNNPTGTVYSEATLQKIVNLALEYDLIIFADEIYDKLIFDGKQHISIASLNRDVPVITFSGMSKNYVVPGWRLGWGIASGNLKKMETYLEAVNKLLRARLCANHPEQFAVPAALDGDQSHLIALNKTLEKRRDLTMNELATIPGISLVKPEGSFYAFASIDVDDDTKFCKELLINTGVVVVPGSGFGQKPGTNHFRIVILPPEEILTKAFGKIAEFYQSYKK
jgi:alanine-synthesizing transaminase